MFKNIYFYRARLFPALITSIPMLVFLNKVIAVQYHDALKNIYDVLPIIAHLGLSAAVIFLCVQINRLTAKEVFQRLYFKEELFMPTTSHLLFNNTHYIGSIKNKIREKIHSKFDISLLNAQDEQEDEIKSRKLIATAVSQIRIALKGNAMLLQHNIEYGFWRNLIGGCLWAVIFSAVIFFYGMHYHLQDLKVIGIICFSIYLVPILLSKIIINYYGRYYSKILYEQFLSLS
ncbi:MAG: hypothetical protein KF741_13195 [Ferruginibacter sp.]|nr:hypothetical protein [Bacteroidota bacterium]MBX2920193.1 hypothetical protein [Ferruginibacter sp.]